MKTKSYDRISALSYATKWIIIIKFEHSLFIIKNDNDFRNISVATHTYDTLGKKIGEYVFNKIRFVHIIDIGI